MFKVAVRHSDTQNGRVESVRLKQLSVFRYLRQPHSATTLKKWRGEESPSVLRRRGCQPSSPPLFGNVGGCPTSTIMNGTNFSNKRVDSFNL
ncbi:MAG: hypothetical protein EWV67_10980 [Microcystis sp. M_QC_C_20170808_M2Col]|nr:MAG: hypothetical protein EWV67_10980 [Microcystis sp. M_QC_C_20170808_M2Col]